MTPTPFEERRLKYLASVNDDVLSENTAPDFELAYVDIGNVDSSGQILGTSQYQFENAPSRARRCVRHGDVIVSTVRTYLKAIAPIANPDDDLVVSTGFAVIRPNPDKLDTRFCGYALREPSFIHEVIGRSVGISYPAINATDLIDIAIPVPSLLQQSRIADYLDREMAKIDSMITANERLLKLLAEKRQALITHAVTRGLYPNVPMRDSGVEWISTVPAHWKSIKLRWLFRQEKRQDYPDLPVLSVYRDYGVIVRDTRDDNANRVPEDLSRYQLVEVGDLVVNKMKSWQGSLGISDYRGITSPDYVVFTPTHSELPDYLNMLLRNRLLTTAYLSMSNGIRTNQWRLEPDRFGTLEVFLPPIAEQEEVVEQVGFQLSLIDELAETAASMAQLLGERRKAVISAAVTGKVEAVYT